LRLRRGWLMPGNPFAKVKPGDEQDIPAAAYNAFVDAALARLRPAGGSGAGKDSIPFDTNTILIVNNSGAAVDRFGVLAFREPEIDPSEALEAFQEDPILDAVAPTADDLGKFCVLLEPIAAGGLGRAMVSGIVTVMIDDGDGSEEFCDCVAGVSDSLERNSAGAGRVLWRAAGTGKQWAVVLLGTGGAESKGEFIGMCHMMVTQNEDGWDDPGMLTPTV
jgi:hypothetical protein